MIDKELVIGINKFIQGKEEGFNVLYEKTYNYVYARARMIMKNDQDAMELLQEVYIAAYKSIGSLENVEAIYGWLGSITYNQGMKMFRKQKEVLLDEDAEGLFDIQETADVSVKPEESVDLKETAEVIMNVINELPENQRAVVTAYYYDEMSVTDIANMFEVSTGTIKSRLNYARKHMKEAIEQEEKKMGVKLHSTSIPAIIIALRMLQEGYKFTESETAYMGVCGALKLTGSVNGTAAATTGTAGKTLAGIASKKFIMGVVTTFVVAGLATFGLFSINNKNKDSQPVEHMKDETEASTVEENITEGEEEVVVEDAITEESDEQQPEAEEPVMDDYKIALYRARYADILWQLWNYNMKPTLGVQSGAPEFLMSDDETTRANYQSAFSYKISDVNGDGVEELFVFDNGGSMADMFYRVYRYDEETMTIKESPVYGDFYENGICDQFASHNQTSSSFWPHSIYKYNSETMMYEKLYEFYAEEYYEGSNFDTGKDADGDGIIYYMAEGEDGKYTPLTQKEYDEIIENVIGNAKLLELETSGNVYEDITQIYSEYNLALSDCMKNREDISDADFSYDFLGNGTVGLSGDYMEKFCEKYGAELVEESDPGFLDANIGGKTVAQFCNYDAGSFTIYEKIEGFSVFGIEIGMPVDDAKNMLESLGFYQFDQDGYISNDYTGFYVYWNVTNGKVSNIFVRVRGNYAG